MVLNHQPHKFRSQSPVFRVQPPRFQSPVFRVQSLSRPAPVPRDPSRPVPVPRVQSSPAPVSRDPSVLAPPKISKAIAGGRAREARGIAKEVRPMRLAFEAGGKVIGKEASCPVPSETRTFIQQKTTRQFTKWELQRDACKS
ncbi:hypothetical protein EYF80_031486 [Liparis tanakae]|uniref:Uncharacterized protein n=1 Tax=Liparis tanakae TaxID=230148 RepID=A0A4Z2GZV6_9TELE|nr:hypothetical protein EYF80_031486 [Liparis tanakae]